MRNMLNGHEVRVRENMPVLPVGKRLVAFERHLHDLAERNASVETVFLVLTEAMKGAEMSVRGPDRDDPKGWGYQFMPDHAIRVMAARTMAQLLGLIKTTVGGVTVNTANQTLNITTAGDRLVELDSIGVPREQIAQACQDLLEATKGASDVSDPDGEAREGPK